jgi:hypothetical protein|tara:strand:- start:3950 stop:4114 length:165 start_codon:yes stop_codon:yes gene_type:complete
MFDLFIQRIVPSIRKKLSFLEEENKKLKNKLQEKQEIINKTNAYWKKKFHVHKS